MNYVVDTRNYAAGTNGFHRLKTAVPGDNSGKSGNSFASFLLGAVYSGSVTTQDDPSLIYPYHAFFAQDSRKVTPRITVNFGLRYELNRAAREASDRASYFDPSSRIPEENESGDRPVRQRAPVLWLGAVGRRFS